MRYDCPSGCAAPTSDFHSLMCFVYTDRPLTGEERLLARLWLRDRVVMAALELLSRRLDSPKMTLEEVIELPAMDTHALLVGLIASVRDDYKRQMAHLAWEHTDAGKGTRH